MPGSIRASAWPDMSETARFAELALPRMGVRLRRVFGRKALVVGGGLLALVVLIALLAPLFAPYDPYAQDLLRRLVPPVWYAKGSWIHPLGTDNLGRDYLSRTLYGARISLVIGVSVMLISGVIGTALGLAAGYFGGRIDLAVTFLVTTRLAMPVILVALAVVALAGSSLMIAEAKSYMFFSFWLIAIPGTMLALLVFAINLTGDGLRDAVAPGGR